ncbi:MAG TPA: UvrD-helicase domain-containing protein, partial [Kofleriaceae bacterium]|nr:UvrD-helicase domain-containing protein [Kofleriaceae bacterium]
MSEPSPEQRDAIRARAPLVTVSAGAGSGKTTVLVERFIDLVQSDGVSPLEILAVTFTEKAAAEMKERIVREFEKRGDVVNRRLSEAAYISTIHGFCSRILREHPLAARLDPSFRVMDEVTRNVFIDEYLEQLYADEWYADTEPLITKRFESLRPRLIELIMEAAFLPDEFGTSVPTEAHLTVDGHVAATIERARVYFANQRALAREQLLAGEDVIDGADVGGGVSRQAHANMCSLIDRLRRDADAVPDWPAEFRENTGFTRGVRNGKRDGIKSILDTVKDTLETCESLDLAEAERLERELFAPIKVGIYEHATGLRAKYEQFKRQHGLLDFTDMQRRALELLDDAEVRERYAKRFKHILLDEAQDTNDVQMRLIRRLERDGQSLFAVGDVKQSIYGFRGANVEIFQALAKRGVRESVSLSLVDNYRSRDRVIAFINEVGTRFWQDGDIRYEKLAPRARYEPNGYRTDVDVWFIDQPRIVDEDGKEKREPVDETREREGIAIAEWIRREIDGAHTVRDPDGESSVLRPIKYVDIAILSNTRNPFPAIERAFADFGIPFVK